MKKTLPILCIAALFSLSACNLLFNRGGKSDKPGESSELLPSQDNPSQQNPSQNPSEPGPSYEDPSEPEASEPEISEDNPSDPEPSIPDQSEVQPSDPLSMAVEAMNKFNYHMNYLVDMFADADPDDYDDYVEGLTDDIGPIDYYYQYPNVHIVWDEFERYYHLNSWVDDNYDFSNITEYYRDDEEVWRTQPYDISGEPNRLKFFDQQYHSVSDFEEASSGENLYCLIEDKLLENEFKNLYMKVELEDGVLTKVTIDALISEEYLDMEIFTTYSTVSIHAELDNFGSVHVTLPQAY